MRKTYTASLLLLLSVLALCYSLEDPHLKDFEDFKTKYGKKYTNDHQHTRGMRNYKDNRQHITKHQLDDPSAKYGHTIFSDLSPQEFQEKHLNFNFDMLKKSQAAMKRVIQPMNFLRSSQQQSNEELPESFDWREKGVITPAKFQDSCGSCWTFSTTGVIESQYAIKYGELLTFSEQMLLDCDSVNQGCRGGLMTDAYQSLQKLGGIQTAADYGSYKNQKQVCLLDKSKIKAKVIDWYQITDDEEVMKRELYKNGPIAVGINARKLQFYNGGVSDPKDCDSAINHAVLIVGYGVENGQRYWLVKNQWGQEWGLDGFFKLARGKHQCGISTYASIAFVEKV